MDGGKARRQGGAPRNQEIELTRKKILDSSTSEKDKRTFSGAPSFAVPLQMAVATVREVSNFMIMVLLLLALVPIGCLLSTIACAKRARGND